MATDIKKSIVSYLEYLKNTKKVSALTITNYQNYLTKFANWYSQEIKNSNELINEKIIKAYINYLKKIKDEKGHYFLNTTKNYYLIALRSFIKYLASLNLTNYNYKDVSLMATIKQPKKFIAEEALNNLLQAPLQTAESDLIKKRDLAILSLLINYGLKVSELTFLKRQNFSTPQTIALKNSKGRIININLDEKSWRLINDYLQTRHDTDPALFISHDRAGRADKRLSKKNYGLTPRSIQRIIQRYGQLSGLKSKITPSYLRYLYGHKLLTTGETLNKVKEILGHSHTNTTKLYQ